MLICASVSISRMNRTHRVQRMQRFRFSMSVGPKSTSARTPSPSNTRRGNSIRLSFGPKLYEKSCSGHSPPLSHTGQSSGWLISRNSTTDRCASCTRSVWVWTTMPPFTVVAHALGLGVDDHAVLDRRRAHGLELRDALDLDQAHAAGAHRLAELRLVAE